jgi:hypothetical protein
MNQKALISSIKGLKEIKPRQEWVVLAKSQIFAEAETRAVKAPAQRINFSEVLSFMFAQRKVAYSFATIMFIFVGLVGFAHYTLPGDALFPLKKITEQSTAALSGETSLKQNVQTLNNRIHDLAQAAKAGKKASISPAIDEVKANVFELAKNLKNNPTDSATIKEIASSLKTLASVQGTDLTSNPDVEILYKEVVENQLADLSKATLTDEQQKIFDDAQKLYDEEKYVDALEAILSI